MMFEEAMSAAETGFAIWATKPHNKRWAKHLDGTPIPNDLLVCVAEEFVRRSQDCQTAEEEIGQTRLST